MDVFTIKIPSEGAAPELRIGNFMVGFFRHTMQPCVNYIEDNPKFWQVESNVLQALEVCKKSYRSKGKFYCINTSVSSVV